MLQITIRVMAFVALVWIFVPSVRHETVQTDRRTVTQEDWHVFGPPDLTAAEWEAACGGPHASIHAAALSLEFYEGSTLQNCEISVAVRCPPDCDTYKTLRDDAR